MLGLLFSARFIDCNSSAYLAFRHFRVPEEWSFPLCMRLESEDCVFVSKLLAPLNTHASCFVLNKFAIKAYACTYFPWQPAAIDAPAQHKLI